MSSFTKKLLLTIITIILSIHTYSYAQTQTKMINLQSQDNLQSTISNASQMKDIEVFLNKYFQTKKIQCYEQKCLGDKLSFKDTNSSINMEKVEIHFEEQVLNSQLKIMSNENFKQQSFLTCKTNNPNIKNEELIKCINKEMIMLQHSQFFSLLLNTKKFLIGNTIVTNQKTTFNFDNIIINKDTEKNWENQVTSIQIKGLNYLENKQIFIDYIKTLLTQNNNKQIEALKIFNNNLMEFYSILLNKTFQDKNLKEDLSFTFKTSKKDDKLLIDLSYESNQNIINNIKSNLNIYINNYETNKVYLEKLLAANQQNQWLSFIQLIGMDVTIDKFGFEIDLQELEKEHNKLLKENQEYMNKYVDLKKTIIDLELTQQLEKTITIEKFIYATLLFIKPNNKFEVVNKTKTPLTTMVLELIQFENKKLIDYFEIKFKK